MFKSATYFFICFTLLLCASDIYCQNQKNDSLKRLLPNCNNDTATVKLLNQIAWGLKGSDPDSAILLSKQALDLAEKTNWLKGLAQSQNQLGTFCTIKSDYALSLIHYQKALDLWDQYILSDNGVNLKSGTLGKSTTLGNLGIVYQEQGNYSKASEYFFVALKMAEELKDKKGIGKHSNNIGLNYYYQNNLEKSLSFFLRGLKMDEELGDVSGIATTLGNIGLIYSSQKKYTKALDSYFKMLKTKQSLGDKSGVAFTHLSIGYVYQELGNLEKALEELFKALELLKELGERNLIAYAQAAIGQVYFDMGKMKEGEPYILDALKLATEIGSLEVISTSEKLLSKLYEKTGKYELAFEHYKKHIAGRDSINNEEIQKNQIRTEMNYEYDKKEAVIKEQREKERAIAAEKNRFQQIVIAVVIFGLLLVIIFSGFVFRSLKTTRKQKVIIEEKQKEILDSIHYARKIQTALMTNENYIDKNLKRLQEK